ncbi:MAG: QueT transporter family protein [Clostridia bacterium]|nr:QueT transporter family protein [Clostridia bacterium]
MNKARYLTNAAIIAAVYIVLTLITNALGLANGAIQVRISEAMCVLPMFTPAAIPGLFIGCMLSNIFTGCVIWDVIFGSLATLIGAVFTYNLRKYKRLALLPPIIANTAIIPFVLKFAYGFPDGLWYFIVTVGIGEIISCGILGTLLYGYLKKYRKYIKW